MSVSGCWLTSKVLWPPASSASTNPLGPTSTIPEVSIRSRTRLPMSCPRVLPASATAAGLTSTTRSNASMTNTASAMLSTTALRASGARSTRRSSNKPPHQQPAGDGERERRQVDEREPADLEVVQDVGRPGQQGRAQQHHGHAAVGPGQPHHAGDEEHRGTDEQQVVVGEDRPEHRPRVDVRQLVRAGCARVGPHQVVRGRHREDCQRSRRRDRQQRHQATGDQPAPAGVLQHEDQPGGCERDDADVLEVAPPAPDRQRVGGELHGVRGPPPRHGDEHHREAPAHGRASTPGDVRRQRRQHQSGARHQGREQRQHPKPPASGPSTRRAWPILHASRRVTPRQVFRCARASFG